MFERNEQTSLILHNEKDKKVTVLGKEFNNDDERRKYFREELRKKLPKLKEQAGYPIADDESIITLSDPPFYTACPNPWLNDLVKHWESEKENYKTEKKVSPFVADVSEGKYDPIYKLHPYHTKVPHKAIMRYLLHYTEPGDIIFDGFAGTGMAGIAAQECANTDVISSLGYKRNEGQFINELGKSIKAGARKTILNDLSPIASYLSYQHNKTVDENYIDNLNVVDEISEEYGWIFKTLHTEDEMLFNVDIQNVEKEIKNNIHLFGNINYVIWSEVFSCPSCASEIVYWEEASNDEDKGMKKTFDCPNCSVVLNKKKLNKVYENLIDEVTNETKNQTKFRPVRINYTYQNKRYNKKPDRLDFTIEEAVNLKEEIEGIPLYPLKKGDEINRAAKSGFEYAHDYYFRKNLLILAAYKNRIKMVDSGFSLTKVALQTTKMYRYNPRGGGPLSGTMYVPSLVKDLNMINQLTNAIKQQSNRIGLFHNSNYAVSTSSTTSYSMLKDESIDYIFIDPPFGANLMYSELSFLWESWLGVFTNDAEEAIINKTQKKSVTKYQDFMYHAFLELYRVLKSGKWMTVEFSNTSSSIWNAIQNAIQAAGFIVANVSVLDKKKGSFKVVTSTTAVKQDLVISAYKPEHKDVALINNTDNLAVSIRSFISQHLEYLPVFHGEENRVESIPERTPRVLFDRMVAYYVQNGLAVPISSGEFQEKLAENFIIRDGMVFLESQVAEYDEKRSRTNEVTQLSIFVSDENSAIEWLRHELMKEPQSRQDLHPKFTIEIQHIEKHEQLLELDDLLSQNFLFYDGNGQIPNQIKKYLEINYPNLNNKEKNETSFKDHARNRWYVPDPNQQVDIEKLREKTLLREFDNYVSDIYTNKKKLKVFRTEAIRVGFKQAWSNRDYQTIVNIGQKLPNKVLIEDDKLLMYYDNALLRVETL